MLRIIIEAARDKKRFCLILLFFISTLVDAQVPIDNLYNVGKRNYAVEPEYQRFTISAHDKAFLVKPAISIYTQLNPLNPKAVYTISPYPDTQFLPRIGKWMSIMNINAQPSYLLPKTTKELSKLKTFRDKNEAFASNLVPAHWISLTNPRGQYIIEPINYLFIVYGDNSIKSLELLNSVLNRVGFSGTASKNHSGGYYAYLGEALFGQLNSKADQALTYSNRDFRYQNDHFRIFGAYSLSINDKLAYIYTTSISEESGLEPELAQLSPEKLELKLDELDKKNANDIYYENYGHHFVSFASARNNLAVALIGSGYPTYYAALGNTVNTLGESTEDHDGNIYITIVHDLAA